MDGEIGIETTYVLLTIGTGAWLMCMHCEYNILVILQFIVVEGLQPHGFPTNGIKVGQRNQIIIR